MKALGAEPLLVDLASSLQGIGFASGRPKPAQLRAIPNRHSVGASTSGHQEWFPPHGKWGAVQPGIHLAPRPNESLLRETSSGGIGIVIAGDSGLLPAGQSLSS